MQTYLTNLRHYTEEPIGAMTYSARIGTSAEPAGGGLPQVALLLETSCEYGRGLLRGVLRYSRLHGPWSLHVVPGHLEQSLPRAESWRGNGIIGRTHSPEMVEIIRSTGLPFVAASLDDCRPLSAGNEFGEINTNCSAIVRIVADHLLERSLRQFAFCGFSGCGWSCHREEIYTQYLGERGHSCEVQLLSYPSWRWQSDWIEKTGDEQPTLEAWLKSLRKPVGIMACNDVCGRRVLQACAAVGLRVPDEVAVVGVDNDEMICELSSPPLSSVVLDLEKAGYEAATLLHQMMLGETKMDRSIYVQPAYIATRQSSDVVAHDDPYVAQALRFVKDHAGQAISVSDVSREVGVSRRTLERRFYAVLGRSIAWEITRCKLERAKRILVETNLPSHRVAAAAGFGSVKTFNRVFRYAEGMPPNDFRLNSRA
jgi:LacI family transcriptional regulator